MTEQKTKIMLLCKFGRKGSSSRLRMLQYIPYLEARGFEIDVYPLLGDDYLNAIYSSGRRGFWRVAKAYLRRMSVLRKARKYDLVWIEKEIFSFLPAFAERYLSLRKVPYAVDYDDATFHRYDSHNSALIRMMFGKKIAQVMKGAALVVAGNKYIADYAKEAGAENIEVIPTVVDVDRYKPVYETSSDVFRIGWIGCPSTARYLSTIQPALKEVCSDGKAVLVSVGSGPIDLDGVPTEIREWTEDTEADDVASFDVGIMPLEDGKWEKGKCGYKLIQYMAAGKPVIASSVGANKDIIDNGNNGYLVGDLTEWRDIILKLKNDSNLRYRLSEYGYSKVLNSYSLQSASPRMHDILIDSAGGIGGC